MRILNVGQLGAMELTTEATVQTYLAHAYLHTPGFAYANMGHVAVSSDLVAGIHHHNSKALLFWHDPAYVAKDCGLACSGGANNQEASLGLKQSLEHVRVLCKQATQGAFTRSS